MKEDYYFKIAKACAEESTCNRRCFGAVIVSPEGYVVATGYNGTPRKTEHCKHCLREVYNVPSGYRYELCLSIHAEQNALLQAGKQACGADMYLYGFDRHTGDIVGMYPCFLCTKFILQSGIRMIHVLEPDGVTDYDPRLLYNMHVKNMESTYA